MDKMLCIQCDNTEELLLCMVCDFIFCTKCFNEHICEKGLDSNDMEEGHGQIS